MTGHANGERVARRVVIRGRVQGVGYRQWTAFEAGRAGLSGFVRNRIDGSVEALFAGSTEEVAAMIDRCRRGPPAASVEEIVAEEAAVPPDRGFHVLATV